MLKKAQIRLNKAMCFSLLMITGNLWADCNISLEVISPIIFNWDKQGADAQGKIILTRSNPGKSRCRKFHITMNAGFGGRYNPRYLMNNDSRLAYNLFTRADKKRIIYHHPFAFSKKRVIMGKFEKHSANKVIRFWARLQKTSDFYGLTSGNFSDQVTVRVYKGHRPFIFLQVADTGRLNISTYLKSSIDISLVSTGAPFDIHDTYENLDFGKLSKSAKKKFDLRVKSNIPYRIMFSSQNNGKLKNLSENSYIDYILKINGLIKNLEDSGLSPKEVISGYRTGQRSVVHPISVQIGSVKNKLSGQYTDIITIEAQAQ